MINWDIIQKEFDRKDNIQSRRKKSKWKHCDHTKWTNSTREKLQLNWKTSKKILNKIYFKK